MAADAGEFPGFDWKNPDYLPIFLQRMERLKRIRDRPEMLPGLKAWYKDHPADFICDWGTTWDPRNVEIGVPAVVPFLLFPKQREWVEYILRKWRERKPGLTEKSRDCGVTWLAVGLGCTLCLHHPGITLGYGSRKEEYVDLIGSPKAMFVRARAFMNNLPIEFRGGWSERRHAPHMRMIFPETEAVMTGEAGDNIGRGDRQGIYFVDESAHLEHPQLVDAALAATTNCRQDVSSVNGMANSFAQKRWGGKIEVFIFDWRDDPRKGPEWYAKQQEELDEVILAQEVDRDYSASVEGIVIPGPWARSAIDAHVRLGLEPTGVRSGALDVADEGPDKNAFCGAHGFLVEMVEEWSGKGSDILQTTERAFMICDDNEYVGFKYDADGLGADVRGDSRMINERRKDQDQRQLVVETFRGSEAVFNPEGQDVKDRKNKDFFMNRKAQGWWSLRHRFQYTHRCIAELDAVAAGKMAEGDRRPVNPDRIISIRGDMPNRARLISELSQATYAINGVGKIVIDKTPDGAASPNMSDAVMIRYSSVTRAMLRISDDALAMMGGKR